MDKKKNNCDGCLYYPLCYQRIFEHKNGCEKNTENMLIVPIVKKIKESENNEHSDSE